MRNEIIHLQKEYSVEIRSRLDSFSREVKQFEIEFRESLPFIIHQLTLNEINCAYALIDKYQERLVDLLNKENVNDEFSKIFQLQSQDYRPLQEFVCEIRGLKRIWDLSSSFYFIIKTWEN